MCGMRIPKKHKEEGKNGKNSAMNTPKTKVNLTLKKNCSLHCTNFSYYYLPDLCIIGILY